MDESQIPGTSSYAKLRPFEEVKEFLRAVMHRSPCRKVIAALGKDAHTHLVGGTLRDAFAGKTHVDIDIACTLRPEEASRRLHAHGIHVVETGLQHGTICAVLNQESIEITTFRKTVSAGECTFGTTIEHDLAARDFTINALAYEVESQMLLDPWGGIEDLSKQLVRAVGVPDDRFREDPLRVMRMIRFGPAEARELDAPTLTSAKRFASRLADISIERIQAEFRKILVLPGAVDALRCMQQTGILEVTIPEALPSVGFEQNQFHTQDVFEHTLTVLHRCPPDLILRLTAFFHDLGKPASLTVSEDGVRHFFQHEVISADIVELVMRRLKFSNEEREKVKCLVRHHMRPIECGPPGLRRILRDLGELFEDWRTFKIADAPPTMPEVEFWERLERFDRMTATEQERQRKAQEKGLAIGGHELIALGYKPGVILGKTLKALEEMTLDNPDLNQPEILLEHARRMLPP